MDIYEEVKKDYPKTFDWLLNTMLESIPQMKEMNARVLPKLKIWA
jgi:hypothetical protein